jgi:CO/xanthine dehydrogenase Mo-binding subunit
MSLVLHGAGFTGSGEVKLQSVAALDLTADGRPRILAANTEIGQGTITAFSQIVGQTLGVPAELVRVERADTGEVPDSGPTVASRTVMVVGGLLERCAQQMRERLELFAERPLRDAADFQRVARAYLAERGAAAYGGSLQEAHRHRVGRRQLSGRRLRRVLVGGVRRCRSRSISTRAKRSCSA